MSQIIKKFIGDNEVGAAKILLENDSALKARNAADDGDVEVVKLDANDKIMLGQDQVVQVYILENQSDSGTMLFQTKSAENSGGFIFAGGASVDGGGGFSVTAGSASFGGTSGGISLVTGVAFESANSGPLTLSTGQCGTDSTGDSGDVLISTGQCGTDSTGDSGDIVLQIGDVASGSKGKILFKDGSEGTAGHVWTSTGTLGEGAWAAPTGSTVDFAKQTFTLAAGDITNQYVDLSAEAKVNSIQVLVKGSGVVLEGASHDYTVSYTGGSGGVTRITFANDLATGGAAELVAGDVLQIQFVEA